MTIYAEIVFLSNLFIDAFLGALTLFFTKGKMEKTRLLLFSVFGAAVSTVYPIFSSYGYIIKILCAITMPIFLTKHTNIKSYLLTLTVFISVTLAMGGSVLFLSTLFSDALSYQTLTYGLFPIMLSGSGLMILFLVGVVKKEYGKVRSKNSLLYDAVISNGNATLKCRAFYDSGNRVYTKNGERVVIVNEGVYNKLMPATTENIRIHTPSGSGSMEITDAKLEIYFADGDNKIYKVKAGKSALNFNGSQIILHSDMLGDYL